MSGINAESLEDALGAAFSGEEAPKELPPKVADKVVPVAEEPAETEKVIEEDPADLLQGSELEETAPDKPAEPSFEIEIDGKPETIQGAERVKELLTRGLKAGRGFEENARVREALQAHVQQAQFSQQFNQAVSQDIAQLQALDGQLQQFDRIDWSALYDQNFQEAFKLKEQRDQLREQRAAAMQNLNAKQQQYAAQFQQNAQRVLAAESEALLAKVPAWRNAEKASQEKGEISGALTSHYGFTPQEVSTIMDHRMLLVARDAAAYRKLLANKDARVKQARQAPATGKPGAAAAQPNGRTNFTKAVAKVRELGTKGQTKAQEHLVTRMLEQTFK